MERRYYILNGRLAQFRQMEEHQAHWEDRWSQQSLNKILTAYRAGRLDEFEAIFTRYLPKDLPVLEAGCGLGQLVAALTARGYAAEGVDYAERTIARLQEVAPDLKTRVGDVYHLDAPDQYYGGYVSIGVFEHRLDGLNAGLREVRRVLNPRGFAFISVPFVNARRRRWRAHAPVAAAEETPEGLRFYQYYYSPEEFRACAAAEGLAVVDELPYAVYSGVTRDYSLGLWLDSHRFFHWRIQRQVSRWCTHAPNWIRRRWAHMLMFVCQPAPV